LRLAIHRNAAQFTVERAAEVAEARAKLSPRDPPHRRPKRCGGFPMLLGWLLRPRKTKLGGPIPLSLRSNVMRRACLGLAALAVALASTAAVAVEDPILTRKKLMDANGASVGAAQAMIKGETPFHPAVAKAALQNFASVGYAFGDYFPPGSDQGDTRASPRIWEDMAGFQQAVTQFRQDSEAALASEPATLEAFQAAMGTVGRHCQSCHEDYRLERN